jgi:hypothetical protein
VGQEPSEIEREIAVTRERLAASVDALADRIAPRNVARRSVQTTKERVLGALGRFRSTS